MNDNNAFSRRQMFDTHYQSKKNYSHKIVNSSNKNILDNYIQDRDNTPLLKS